jgi:hypothetical protein
MGNYKCDWCDDSYERDSTNAKNKNYCSKKCHSEAKANGEEKKGCFIATAVYGDYHHPIVIDLRSFRDKWLNKQSWGKNFIFSYYKYGPFAADFIEKNRFLKILALIFIVKPLHFIVKLFNLHK